MSDRREGAGETPKAARFPTLALPPGPALLILLVCVAAAGALQRRLAPHRLGEDMIAALNWLRMTTAPDAAILAHWHWGGAIRLVAERRPVAPVNATPSGAAGADALYRELAAFFFAEDEAEALSIAKRHGASHVLLPKDFPGRTCSIVLRCQFATKDRRTLNPEGLAVTMAGRMIRGASFESFQRVWDSPRYAIYQVGEGRSGLSVEERLLTLELSRRVIGSALAGRSVIQDPSFLASFARAKGSAGLGERRAVQVRVWSEGRLRASRSRQSGTVLQNLLLAADDAASGEPSMPLRTDELERMRLQVRIPRGDYAPLTSAVVARGRVARDKAYVLAVSTPVYSFPEDPATARAGSLGRLLGSLCASAGLSPRCHRSVAVYTFSFESFMEAAAETAPARPATFRRQLEGRVRLASDWLVGRQGEGGWFAAWVDPYTGREAYPRSCVDEALATLALARASRVLGDRRLLASAAAGASFVDKQLRGPLGRSIESTPADCLSAGLLGALELRRATRESVYEKSAATFHAALEAARAKDPRSSGGDSAGSLMFAAMTAWAKAHPSDEAVRALRELAEYHMGELRSRRMRGSREPVERLAWFIEGLATLDELAPDSRYPAFALEAADWLLEQQVARGDELLEGAFSATSGGASFDTVATGRAARAMALADRLAQANGLGSLAGRYRASWLAGLRWLMRMQLTRDDAYFVPPRSIAAALGGVRRDPSGYQLWSASAAGFLSAAEAYFDHALAP
ncbi:MAG: hypothetical protein HY554_12545 [Elusimicrobia bacterium]|nr:hypothetical protein [Elusimicrobiota bacterium]